MSTEDEAVHIHVLANEVRSEIPNSILGVASIFAATAYIQWAFTGLADATLLTAWSSVMYLCGVFWVCGVLLILTRTLSPTQLVHGWAVAGRCTMAVVNINVALGVWLLMPASQGDMRILTVVLYLWFITTQLLGSTEATQIAWPATVGVLGSLAVYFLVEDGSKGIAIAFFLAFYGATALGLRAFVRAAVLKASMANALSDRAARTLQEALEVTAAERDSKTRFIQAATHDLQQPIQAASLHVDNALAATTPEERERAAAGARAAFASTRLLLEHMLEHLRLEAGAVQLRPGPMPLAPLITAVVGEHAPAAAAAGMRISTPATGLWVEADGPALSRALGNLVGNAIRHARGERVLVGGRRRPDGDIDLWVIDDGEGVPESEADRLFDDFAQGVGAAGRGGFGLGLSSVRRIALLMDGSAGLDRRWTGGAAFYIRLPAAVGQTAASRRQYRSVACAPA